MTTLTREKIKALREAARTATAGQHPGTTITITLDPATILSLCDMAEAGAVPALPAWNDLPQETRTRLVEAGNQWVPWGMGGDAAVFIYEALRSAALKAQEDGE